MHHSALFLFIDIMSVIFIVILLLLVAPPSLTDSVNHFSIIADEYFLTMLYYLFFDTAIHLSIYNLKKRQLQSF